jgi:hypothetical protein
MCVCMDARGTHTCVAGVETAQAPRVGGRPSSRTHAYSNTSTSTTTQHPLRDPLLGRVSVPVQLFNLFNDPWVAVHQHAPRAVVEFSRVPAEYAAASGPELRALGPEGHEPASGAGALGREAREGVVVFRVGMGCGGVGRQAVPTRARWRKDHSKDRCLHRVRTNPNRLTTDTPTAAQPPPARRRAARRVAQRRAAAQHRACQPSVRGAAQPRGHAGPTAAKRRTSGSGG